MVILNHMKDRQEIQEALEPAIHLILNDLGIAPSTMDAAHNRRAVRAILRIATRLARTRGCTVQGFLAIAYEAFAKEAALRPVAQA
jgi:hypothetical protein